MTYGTRIKQAREDLRLTQEQLAEQLDVSRQAVSKWEADLSRPTREKLDRLSDILDIPPETWAQIDAELEAAAQPPDASRPWKIATAVLAAACLILAVCLTAALWPKANEDVPLPPEEQRDAEGNEPAAPCPGGVLHPFPDTLPLSVRRDFDFGDWPLGEYDPAEVPYLEDDGKVMENELWRDWFPDGTRLSLVKASAYWDQTAARSNIYLLWAPPVETTGGDLEYRILYRIGEDYFGEDCGDLEAVPFKNVLGYDGFKITMSHADNFYRDSAYIAPGPDGVPCMVTMTGAAGREADINDDGVLEIASFNQYLPGWEIIDTTQGEEGSFTYTLNYADLELPDDVTFDFNPDRGGFILYNGDNALVSRYVLRDGELVRLPPTDFSTADYPDVVGTELTFITDEQAGDLSDKIDPDDILPYTPDVRITHRQQAYLALQELYNMTGLKVDSCYCAASEYGVHFSLLPDGFNQRSFFYFGFNTRYGNVDHIPSLYINWKEVGDDWSPLSLEEAARPGPGTKEEDAILWYYDRMKFFSAGEASHVNFEDLWLENGDRYVCSANDTEWGPALWSITGPYPDGEINH